MFQQAANRVLQALLKRGIKSASIRQTESGHSVYVETGPGLPAVLIKDGPAGTVFVTYYGLQARPAGTGYNAPVSAMDGVAAVLAGETDIWDSAPDGRLERRSMRPW